MTTSASILPSTTEPARRANKSFSKLAANAPVLVIMLGEGRAPELISRRAVEAVRGGRAVVEARGWSEAARSSDGGNPLTVFRLSDSREIDERMLPFLQREDGQRPYALIVVEPGIPLRTKSTAVFWKLKLWTVELPSWREVYPDPLLPAELLLTEINRQERRRLTYSDAAKAAIRAHTWINGDVELSARVERAALLTDDEELSPEALGLAETPEPKAPTLALAAAKACFEMLYVAGALAQHDGSRTQAARALDVDSRTVFRAVKRLRESAPERAGDQWPSISQICELGRRVGLVSPE